MQQRHGKENPSTKQQKRLEGAAHGVRPGQSHRRGSRPFVNKMRQVKWLPVVSAPLKSKENTQRQLKISSTKRAAEGILFPHVAIVRVSTL